MKKGIVLVVIILSLLLVGCKKKEVTSDPFDDIPITLTNTIMTSLEDSYFYYIQRVTDTEYIIMIDFIYYLFDSTNDSISEISYDYENAVLVQIDGEKKRILFIDDNILNIADFNGNITDHIDFTGDIFMRRIGDYFVIIENTELNYIKNIHIYNLELEYVRSYNDYQYTYIIDRHGNYEGYASKNGDIFEIVNGELVKFATIEDRGSFVVWEFDENHIIITNYDSDRNSLEHTEYYTFNGDDLTLFYTGSLSEHYDYCSMFYTNPYLCITDYVEDEQTYITNRIYKVFDGAGNEKTTVENTNYLISFNVLDEFYYVLDNQELNQKQLYDWENNLFIEYTPEISSSTYVSVVSVFGRVFFSEINYGGEENIIKFYMYDEELIEIDYSFNQMFTNQPIVYKLTGDDTIYMQTSETTITEINNKDINDINDPHLLFEVFNNTIRYMTEDGTYMAYTLEGDFLYEYKVILEPTNYLFGNRFAPYNDMKYMVVEFVEDGRTMIVEVENMILTYN